MTAIVLALLALLEHPMPSHRPLPQTPYCSNKGGGPAPCPPACGRCR